MSPVNHLQPVMPDEHAHGMDFARFEAERPVSESSATHDSIKIPNWVANASRLWRNRRTLARTAAISLVLALAFAFQMPKQYESSAHIMPPSNSMGGTALLAALAGRAGGSLGSLSALAGGFLGGGGNTALFIDLLRSGTVTGHLIDKFDLQHVYHKRYRVDTAKYIARHTKIVDDKKSGVITLTFTDTDPVRARDIAQGYLDELNLLVNRTNTSSAHQERIFIESRLRVVQQDLQRAQQQLSEFSSTHATIDIKEQGRSMVDAAARLQAQLIIEEAGLDSLRQTYGDGNIRVRSAQARIGELQAQIAKMGGSSKALSTAASTSDSTVAPDAHDDDLYPPLRQLPRLAVPYANLYREVQVQETVYELLTQQYELARVQEAKDVPVVSVIDAPGIPEKKSLPPRLTLALALTFISVAIASLLLVLKAQWMRIEASDPRKVLAHEIGRTSHNWLRSYLTRARSMQ
jgi:capsule polysaccharide export protein KpsE/RkpR